MKILSLFDGISCGQIAMQRANIPIEVYYASEIDKYAIQITQKNYPNTVQLGDVRELNAKNLQIDLLIGGSPCQDLSIIKSKTRESLKGPKSSLFWQFVRILKETKPKYFLLENVAGMTEESKDIISSELGVNPVQIDSKYFSAQERPRLYWTNIPVNIKGLIENPLVLQDVLEPDVDEKYFYNYPLINVDMTKQVCAIMDFKNHQMHKRVFNPAFKMRTLTTCGGGGNTQKKVYINGRARKLTPVEYERLQTVPDNYTDCVSNTRRYTALGNGWTVDVIAYIFSFMEVKSD